MKTNGTTIYCIIIMTTQLQVVGPSNENSDETFMPETV